MAEETRGNSIGWFAKKRRERGRRALERQLEYQEEKAAAFRENDEGFVRSMFLRSQAIRQKIERIHPIAADARILEVGSGAHGLIFCFGSSFGVGIDPLAVDYKRLFPKWQDNAPTVAAIGEQLPFGDAAFDIVLSDNVVDHAEDPVQIVHELVRVLKPGGVIYFTVNIHHPFYELASRAHGAWNALGIKFELSPFADHTVHFSEARISKIFAKLSLKIIQQNSTVAATKSALRQARLSHPDTLLKKMFFKNALFEVVAVRE